MFLSYSKPRRIRHSAQLCTTISNRSEHGHDVLRHLLAPRQQHQERQEDQQQRTPLPRLVNLRHVILRRELGSALADQHVQRPRQRQAGRDDTEREAEVDPQRRQPESPAPEPVLDYPTAVDLAHGEHVQRLGHEAAPVNEDVGGGWSATVRVVFWIIWSFGHLVIRTTPVGSLQSHGSDPHGQPAKATTRGGLFSPARLG